MSIEKEIIKLIEENDNVLDINLFNTAYAAGISLYSVLIDSIRIASNDNEIYAIFAAEDKPLILQFKDKESIDLAMKDWIITKPASYSFDYNMEKVVTIDNHVLRTIYLLNSLFGKNTIIIADDKTKVVLACIDSVCGTHFNDDMVALFNLKADTYDYYGWYATNKIDMPDELKTIITSNEALLRLSE